MAMSTKQVILDCDCYTTSHKVIVTRDDWDDEPQLVLYVQMNQWRAWWKRAWWAFKWIFGKAAPYGHWDTTLLGREQALKLKELVDEYVVHTEPKVP